MGVIKDGKVKPLAVSTARRIAALPNIPTVAEAGYPNAENTFWLAMLAPAKTPRDVVAKLNAETNRALQAPEMKERLTKLGTETMAMSPAEVDKFIATEYRELGDVMVKAGLKPQ
jgi:tripartite-type tricarboxylate transporter receptor subunit TctC